MAEKLTSVAVVDDDEVVRQACIDALVADGLDARAYASAHAMCAAAEQKTLPRVVLLDLDLPGESAFDAIRTLRRLNPEVQIIAFTGHAGDSWLFSALTAGCIGYVLKVDTTPIAATVRAAAAGGSPMTAAIARRVIERMHCPTEDAPSLSPRELQVLEALAAGYRYEQIAARLELSISTVRTHLQSVYVKLGVTTKSEAAARALRLGLLS